MSDASSARGTVFPPRSARPHVSLRTGVLGAGVVAHNNHFPTLARNPRTELVAVCDTDERKAEEASRDYGTRFYADPERFFAREELDWVHVATPIHTHLDLVTRALDRGVPATVQKPAALTPDEVREMSAQAHQAGVPVSVVHNWTYYPLVRRLQEALEEGAVGDVRAVEVSFSGEGRPDETYQGPWVFDLPGGDFEEGIAHPLYLTLALAGPPSLGTIQASTRTFDDYDREIAYDGFGLQYVTDDGVLARVTCLSGSSREQTVRVHGEEGSITADLPTRRLEHHDRTEGPFHFFGERLDRGLATVRTALEGLATNLSVAGRAGVEERLDRHKEDSVDGHYHLLNEAAKALEEGRQPPVPLERARWTVELVERVRRAAGAKAP